MGTLEPLRDVRFPGDAVQNPSLDDLHALVGRLQALLLHQLKGQDCLLAYAGGNGAPLDKLFW